MHVSPPPHGMAPNTPSCTAHKVTPGVVFWPSVNWFTGNLKIMTFVSIRGSKTRWSLYEMEIRLSRRWWRLACIASTKVIFLPTSPRVIARTKVIYYQQGPTVFLGTFLSMVQPQSPRMGRVHLFMPDDLSVPRPISPGTFLFMEAKITAEENCKKLSRQKIWLFFIQSILNKIDFFWKIYLSDHSYLC